MNFKEASLTAFTSLFIISATTPSQAQGVSGVGFSFGGGSGGASIGGSNGGASSGNGSDVVVHEIVNGRIIGPRNTLIASGKCKAMKNMSARFHGKKMTQKIKKKFRSAGGGKRNVKVWNQRDVFYDYGFSVSFSAQDITEEQSGGSVSLSESVPVQRSAVVGISSGPNIGGGLGFGGNNTGGSISSGGIGGVGFSFGGNGNSDIKVVKLKAGKTYVILNGKNKIKKVICMEKL